MDTFMDKLAQKLTAQEMIKANAAAEAEELNRLQSQVKEYHECLAQMRIVNEDMHKVTGQMSSLIDESMVSKINQIEETLLPKISQLEETILPKISQLEETILPKISQLEETILPKIGQLEETILPRISQLEESIQAKTAEEAAEAEKLEKAIGEVLDQIKALKDGEGDQDAWKKSLGEMFERSDEHVHKENVKVYRNVQAVVMEESKRQIDAMDGGVKTLSGKLKLVFGVSLAALIVALGDLVFQILRYFQIF